LTIIPEPLMSSSTMMRTIWLAGVILPALFMGGCNSTATPVSSAPPSSSYTGLAAGVAPAGFRLPAGTGCAGDIARWQAIQDNDLNSGHVNQKVYDQIQGDIRQASSACAAGRDAEAQGIVRSSRSRHGYPAG
jgi:hypothetical protein